MTFRDKLIYGFFQPSILFLKTATLSKTDASSKLTTTPVSVICPQIINKTLASLSYDFVCS